MIDNLPSYLGLQKEELTVVRENPDRPNIFLEVKRRPSNYDISQSSRFVYESEIQTLKEMGESYPVKLRYMPLEWCADAVRMAEKMIGKQTLSEVLFVTYFSTQHDSIIQYLMTQLNRANPRLRLVFCSSVVWRTIEETTWKKRKKGPLRDV